MPSGKPVSPLNTAPPSDRRSAPPVTTELTAEYGKPSSSTTRTVISTRTDLGKDFNILNLREETTEDKTETLCWAIFFPSMNNSASSTKTPVLSALTTSKKPLWVFVGSSVNAVYSEDKEKRSDVLTIVRFLHHFWKTSAVGRKHDRKLLDAKTGIGYPRRTGRV